MNTTTIAQSAEVHESLRHLFYADGEFDIRANFEGAAYLPEGDPHWVDQDEIRRERPDVMGKDFYVVRVYDLRTGERLFNAQAPEGWYPEQLGDWYEKLLMWGRNHPNTYVVNGDYLFVSGGAWVMTGMPNADGEVEFTAWSKLRAEMNAEAEAERTEWLAENAEAIAKVRPAWADPDLTWVDLLSMDDDDLDPDMIEFRRNVGGVAIEQCCYVDNGVFTLQGEPQIRVTEVTDDHGVFAVDHAPQIGANLITAAYYVTGNEGDVSVEVIAVVARAFGMLPGELWGLAEGRK